MKDCNCHEHQSYQSIYCMLHLNETASEEELLHAYNEEMTQLEKLQPISELEQKLRDAKKQELICSMDQAKSKTLSQRVQTQYRKRKHHSERLYSFFPVGILGLIFRLFNVTIGSDGCCDKCLYSIFDGCDQGCCRCSCCNDDCCFSDLYSAIFSECICECPSGIAKWYENTPTIRVIDMGVVIVVAAGAVLCYIKNGAEAAAGRIKRSKQLSKARTQLHELTELLHQRDDMISKFTAQYDQMEVFSLDVRPFTKFIAGLSDATAEFCDMARRLEEPGSFYDEMLSKCKELDKLRTEIVEMNGKCVKIAETIRANETHHDLDAREHCSRHLESAFNGLDSNPKYKTAVEFIKSKLH